MKVKRARLTYEDQEPPWKHSDGHGEVSDWTTRDKAPGERVLSSDGENKRYYDFAGTIKLAHKDGWGVKSTEGKTKGQIAAEAVEADFEYLRRWCVDDWTYIGVVVTLLDIQGNETRERESIWGIESDSDDYLTDTAYELAGEISHRVGVSDVLTIKVR